MHPKADDEIQGGKHPVNGVGTVGMTQGMVADSPSVEGARPFVVDLADEVARDTALTGGKSAHLEQPVRGGEMARRERRRFLQRDVFRDVEDV